MFLPIDLERLGHVKYDWNLTVFLTGDVKCDCTLFYYYRTDDVKSD